LSDAQTPEISIEATACQSSLTSRLCKGVLDLRAVLGGLWVLERFGKSSEVK